MLYSRGMADDEMDREEFEGDDWDVAGMPLGEYRRMAARVEAEGRDGFTPEELARFDAAHKEYVEVSKRAQQSVASMMPDLSEALRKARETALGSMTSKWRDDAEESVREFASTPFIEPPQIDEGMWDSLAEAKQEERDREIAQVEALDSIAGHMAEMKSEQEATSLAAQATTTEVEKLRTDGRKAGRWTIVSAIAASVAAVFAVLVYFFPLG